MIPGLRSLFGSPPQNADELLASLILAAREDAGFKARVVALLRLPPTQREPLVRTAIEEMRLRGESPQTQAAFAVLATQAGAQTALRLLAAD